MKVIIPLAGFGTRLRPHTYTRPKPLINVAGKPVLGHILDKLADLDVEEIIFIVGYLGEQIEKYVSENYHFKARYVEQKELLGQAHAIHLAKEMFSGPIIILFVDTLFEADLEALEHEQADGVIYVKEVVDPRRFGVVIRNGEGRITRLIEKPDSMQDNLAVIGLYYVKDSQRLVGAIDELMARKIQTKGEYYLADAFQLMIDNGAFFRAEPVDVWLDCGKPETVLETNRYLLANGMDNSDHFKAAAEEFVVVPPVHIDPTAQIRHSVIGPNVTIAAHCKISNAIIKDSIIDQEATISDTMLDQSLVGRLAVVTGRYRQYNVGDSSLVGFS
jgi:glucose-1-phosphate thymidylyltransferase